MEPNNEVKYHILLLLINHCVVNFRHFQKPDTPYTMKDIANWAKKPFTDENLFVVGESYHPMRGWCEGAIVSCRNALKVGWGIERNVQQHAKRSFFKTKLNSDSPARA